MNLYNKRDAHLVWAFFIVAAITNCWAFPDIWMVWGMLMCCMGVMSIIGNKLPRLIGMSLWVSMGTVLLGLSMFIMAGAVDQSSTDKNTSALLFIVYILFTAPFLARSDKQESHQMFVLLAPLHMTTQLASLLIQEKFQVLGVALLIQVVIYLAFIYQPSAATRGHDQIWAGKIILLCLALGGGVFLGRQIWDLDTDRPSIGDLPGISRSNKPVLAVIFPNEQPSGTLYVEQREIYVLPDMSGGWTSFDALPLKVKQPLIAEFYIADTREGKDTPIDFKMVGGSGVFLYSLPGDVMGRTIKSTYQTGEGVYAFTSQAWQEYEDRKTGAGFRPDIEALYLSIPKDPESFTTQDGVDLEGAKLKAPATWAMVQEWRKQGLTDEQFIQKTLDYFRDNLAYHYDHQYPDEERNRLDWFLFTDRKGVCRHFSNAFALIMRMGGIKSRIRGGFAGGVSAQIDGQAAFVMRKRDAHAWVEVWQDGKGWVLIDPTSVVPVEKDIPEDNSLIGGLFDGFDGGSFGSFKTAGMGSVGSSTNGSAIFSMMDKLDPEQTRKLAAWIMAAVGMVVLTVVGVVAWRKYRSVPQQERQWKAIREQLTRRGVPLLPSDGPRSVAHKAMGIFGPDQAQHWLAAVEAYERWKFGGQGGGDVVVKLRRAYGIIKQYPRARAKVNP